MSQTITKSEAQAKVEERTKQPWLWNVVLLNDEEHTYEYVMRMMGNVFGHATERAYKIAKTVDSQGRAICLTAHKELAELKRDQVHAFGRDPLMLVSKGSMSCVIEPAEFGGDDSGESER